MKRVVVDPSRYDHAGYVKAARGLISAWAGLIRALEVHVREREQERSRG